MTVKKKVHNKSPSLRGRPNLRNPSERKLPRGLSIEQWQRIKDEAQLRGISPAAMQRMIVEWYFTIIDTKRGDSETNKLFDNDNLKVPNASE